MIDQVDERLRKWVQETLGILPSLAPPGDTASDGEINLYLLELAERPPARGARRPPLQMTLRYLVTAWANQPEEAHRLLGKLTFAAMEHPDFEVKLNPIPAETWKALGVIPRPSFVLQVPLRKEQPTPPTQYVREPLVVQATPVISLVGTVLGPKDVPIARATVEIPALQLSTRTDAKGQFTFANVPADPLPKKLRVKAKGRELDVTTEQLTPDEPFVIRFNLFE
jgi:hypothetical protein